MSGSTETTYNITSRTDYDGDIIDVTINGTSFATIIHNDIVREMLTNRDGFIRDKISKSEFDDLTELLSKQEQKQKEDRKLQTTINTAEQQILENLRKPRNDSDSLIQFWEEKLNDLGKDGPAFTKEQRHGIYLQGEECTFG